jgi:excisionase family DNA binding protein
VRSNTINQRNGLLPEVRDRKAPATMDAAGAKRPFTVRQAAERLGCSGDHIRNLIATRRLRAVIVPGLGRRAARVLILPADLAQAIESWRV